MRQNHFTMLPERAFQPRGPIGMTLHGPIEFVGDVISGAVDVVKDVGSFIDDNVIQPILEDPVEAIVVATATYFGGAPGAFIAKTGMELDDGKELDEALESGAKTAAGVYIGGEVSSAFGGSGATGTEGFGQFSDEVYQGASGTVPGAATSAAAPVDYSLVGSSQFQTPAPDMGGGTGITSGSSGQGLQIPEAPNISKMGGGQGLLAPVDGGTVGQLGLISDGATPVLGNPSSIINQPDVLGTPVLQQGTPPTISIQDALRGARLVNNLLTPQQPQVPNMLGRAQEALAQQSGVDYNALLGLLNQRASAAGLLGTRFQPQPINIASLLG